MKYTKEQTRDLINIINVALKHCTHSAPFMEFLNHLIKENEALQEDARMLECLRAAGVDNWEGYADAMEMFAGEDA